MKATITLTYNMSAETAAKILAQADPDAALVRWASSHPENISDVIDWFNAPRLRNELGRHLAEEATKEANES